MNRLRQHSGIIRLPFQDKLYSSMKPVCKASDPFYLENGELCPFCEDENKIPVVINNNLSKEIKKIPMNVFRDDASLMGNKFGHLFQNTEAENHALRKIYSNYVYKDFSNEISKNSQTMLPTVTTLPENVRASDMALANDNKLNSLNPVQNSVDPASYFMHLKQQINRPSLLDIDSELSHEDFETSHRIGLMIQSVIEDYKQKFHINDQKDQSKKSDCSTVGRKALHVCRQKDPFLREINVAIFGASQLPLPKEGTDEYYKLAQEYAIFHATPSSTSDFGSSKNDYSPSKSANDMNKNLFIADSKLVDFKRPPFDDPAIISEDPRYPTATQHQLQSPRQQHQLQSFGATHPTLDGTSLFFVGGTQGSYANPNAGCSHNMSSHQLPGSFLAYSNLNQKAKPRTSPKPPHPAQIPMFLSPHQYLMQASQSATFPSATNYSQTMMQPQPNFGNLQAAAPFYNASFKETHINTAIIQQQQYQQYQQYNVLAAAAAGNYEMLVYEQMLHQTQKIKTIVARNRLDKRIQSELAKNALKTNITLSPTSSTSNPFGNPPSARGIDNLQADAAIRTLLSQIGERSGVKSVANDSNFKEITDPAIISAVDSGSTYVNLALDARTFDTKSNHQNENCMED